MKILTDALLNTSAVRDDLLNEGSTPAEDHCRVCGKLGKFQNFILNILLRHKNASHIYPVRRRVSILLVTMYFYQILNHNFFDKNVLTHFIKVQGIVILKIYIKVSHNRKTKIKVGAQNWSYFYYCIIE